MRKVSKKEDSYPSLRQIKFFRKLLLNWFSKNGRKFPWRGSRISNYNRIIAEILLQRTKAEIVKQHYNEFLEVYPDWKSIANASNRELGKVLRPLGLWRKRSITLKKLAVIIDKSGGKFPKDVKALEFLPGIGQYISNSIMLFYFKNRSPLLDVNVARLLSRYFGISCKEDLRFDLQMQCLAREIVNCDETITVNLAMIDYASLICKNKSAICSTCLLRKNCSFYDK